MIKFEISKKYSCRSICDSDATWKYTIEKRTDKSLWIDGKRFVIQVNEEEEFIYPEGKYSMCPVLRASKAVKEDNKVIKLETRLKYKLECGCSVSSKKEVYKCGDCGKELCSKHTYYYTDESNIAITRNSKGFCVDCYNKKYRREA